MTIVDNIPKVLGPVVVLTGIGVMLGTVFIALSVTDGEEELAKKLMPIYKNVVGSFIISMSLAIFTPSSKGIAFIYIAPQIIENGAVKDTVKNIPELTKLGTEYLKEILADKIQETK